MPKPVAFYFDFSSPYGYLAAQGIDELAARHGREVLWKPVLLGVLFRVTGQRPLLDIAMKGDYVRRDLARAARAMAVPFVVPDSFPFASQVAARAFYWLQDRDPGQARRLAKALYRTAFGEGRDIAQAEAVLAVAADLGVPTEELAASLADPALKERLRQEVAAAQDLGVFGSPFFLVDGEPFWGNDRLPDVERWLAAGGW